MLFLTKYDTIQLIVKYMCIYTLKGAEYFVEKNTIWQKILKLLFYQGLNGIGVGVILHIDCRVDY